MELQSILNFLNVHFLTFSEIRLSVKKTNWKKMPFLFIYGNCYINQKNNVCENALVSLSCCSKRKLCFPTIVTGYFLGLACWLLWLVGS